MRYGIKMKINQTNGQALGQNFDLHRKFILLCFVVNKLLFCSFHMIFCICILALRQGVNNRSFIESFMKIAFKSVILC